MKFGTSFENVVDMAVQTPVLSLLKVSRSAFLYLNLESIAMALKVSENGLGARAAVRVSEVVDLRWPVPWLWLTACFHPELINIPKFGSIHYRISAITRRHPGNRKLNTFNTTKPNQVQVATSHGSKNLEEIFRSRSRWVNSKIHFDWFVSRFELSIHLSECRSRPVEILHAFMEREINRRNGEMYGTGSHPDFSHAGFGKFHLCCSWVVILRMEEWSFGVSLQFAPKPSCHDCDVCWFSLVQILNGRPSLGSKSVVFPRLRVGEQPSTHFHPNRVCFQFSTHLAFNLP